MDRDRGKVLLVLVGLIAIASIALYAIDAIDTKRRSATAAVQISSSVLVGGGTYSDVPTGTRVRYSYVVNGTAYSGEAVRRWLNVNEHDPKVCFDPNDPSSHLLVEGSFRCGVGP